MYPKYIMLLLINYVTDIFLSRISSRLCSKLFMQTFVLLTMNGSNKWFKQASTISSKSISSYNLVLKNLFKRVDYHNFTKKNAQNIFESFFARCFDRMFKFFFKQEKKVFDCTTRFRKFVFGVDTNY